MKILAASLFLLAGCATAQAPSDHETAIANASKKAALCRPVGAFDDLFQLSASGEVTGTHTSEELSEANEEAFLKCPLEFLTALNAQPEQTQKQVAALYFGIRHAPWELGAELRKYQNNKQVGALVRARFGHLLSAKEPK